MSNLLSLTDAQLAERFEIDFEPAVSDLRLCLEFDSGLEVALDEYDDAVDRLEAEGFLDALEAAVQANVPTAKG